MARTDICRVSIRALSALVGLAALAGDDGKGGSSVLTFLPYAAGPIIGLLVISSKDDKAEELITVVPQQVAAFEKYDQKNPANIVVVPVETLRLSKSLKAVSAPSPGLHSTNQHDDWADNGKTGTR